MLLAYERHMNGVNMSRLPILHLASSPSRHYPFCMMELSSTDSMEPLLWSATSVFQENKAIQESVLMLRTLFTPGSFPTPTTHLLFPTFGFLNDEWRIQRPCNTQIQLESEKLTLFSKCWMVFVCHVLKACSYKAWERNNLDTIMSISVFQL